MNDNKIILLLLRIACALAFLVIVVGAYTRLSDAGLGCPDWPGCYGNLIVPDKSDRLNETYPERPLELGKAWTEMAHRYAASSLGLLILIIAIMSWTKSSLSKMRVFTSGLLLLVIFQGMLGMWTVTLIAEAHYRFVAPAGRAVYFVLIILDSFTATITPKYRHYY